MNIYQIPQKPDGFSVTLTLSDGLGEILNMKLYVATEEQAAKITNTFQKNAEQIYGQFIETLLDDHE